MTINNSIQLIGNLGSNPSIYEFENGTQVARVPLATHSAYKNGDGDLIKQTQWHTIVAWNARADYLKRFLRKGSFVGVRGKIVNRSFETNAGEQRQVTEIVVREFMKFNPREQLAF